MSTPAEASQNTPLPPPTPLPERFKEVADPGLTAANVLQEEVPKLLVMLAVGGFIVGGAAWNILRMKELSGQLVVGVALVLVGGIVALLIRTAISGALRRWRMLSRIGGVRLRVPRAALVLDTRPQVELAFPHEVPELSRLQATLRRVRLRTVTRGTGKNRRTVTVRDTDYEHSQTVSTPTPGPGRNIVLTLEPAPPPEPPSDLSASEARRSRLVWELSVTSDTPGVDLETTFPLDVAGDPEVFASED
jgi:hypothetical protein